MFSTHHVIKESCNKSSILWHTACFITQFVIQRYIKSVWCARLLQPFSILNKSFLNYNHVSEKKKTFFKGPHLTFFSGFRNLTHVMQSMQRQHPGCLRSLAQGNRVRSEQDVMLSHICSSSLWLVHTCHYCCVLDKSSAHSQHVTQVTITKSPTGRSRLLFYTLTTKIMLKCLKLKLDGSYLSW